MGSIAVVICAYADERCVQLAGAIRSVLSQTRRPDRMIVVIDHNDRLLEETRAAFPATEVIANAAARGLSGARNTGIRAAAGQGIIAFLDDDALAEPDWLGRMERHYDDPAVLGVGGKVVPLWEEGRPRWFPEEFQWVVGCSYRGLPEGLHPIRNPIGCNMSFRRMVFDTVGGFREGIGRTGQDAAGCEETELSIRARQTFPDGVILYDPEAIVRHQVAGVRARWGYFRRRCLAEGRSKRAVAASVGARDGLAAEGAYVTRTLPGGFARGLADTVVRRDPSGLLRAAGIVAGLGFTAAGYLSARFSLAGLFPAGGRI